MANLVGGLALPERKLLAEPDPASSTANDLSATNGADITDVLKRRRRQDCTFRPITNVLTGIFWGLPNSSRGMNFLFPSIPGARSSISRGDELAHCRGFGTCGWTDVGGTSTRTKIVGPTALAARPTLYVSGARPQRPVGCPSTLAREVELLRPKPTRIPVTGLHSPSRRRGRPAGWT